MKELSIAVLTSCPFRIGFGKLAGPELTLLLDAYTAACFFPSFTTSVYDFLRPDFSGGGFVFCLLGSIFVKVTELVAAG